MIKSDFIVKMMMSEFPYDVASSLDFICSDKTNIYFASKGVYTFNEKLKYHDRITSIIFDAIYLSDPDQITKELLNQHSLPTEFSNKNCKVSRTKFKIYEQIFDCVFIENIYGFGHYMNLYYKDLLIAVARVNNTYDALICLEFNIKD